MGKKEIQSFQIKNQKSSYSVEYDDNIRITFFSIFTQGWEVLPNSATELLPKSPDPLPTGSLTL